MENKETLSAPEIDNYLHWLGNIHYRLFNNDTTYDDESYKLIDQFYERIKCIQHKEDHGAKFWTLWFKANRGPIEDFGDFEEYKLSGEIDSLEQFEQLWHMYYPDEEVWHEIRVGEDNGYRWIILHHQMVIEVDPNKSHKDWPQDIRDFVQWLLYALDECIELLKKGTYYDLVDKQLPPELKVGTIKRIDYWNAYPEEREAFFKDIEDADVDRAIKLMQEQPSYEDFSDRIPSMTANEFYRICSLGYKANRYEYIDLPPKDQYYRHADGRDDGLQQIDGDSPEAFHDWLNDMKRLGGHPWEVCRGGNSTHITLRVAEDENGYYLFLAGSAVWRTIETLKFYLALKDEGLPVFIMDANELTARLKGEERIGIVPDGVIPKYCSSWFPGEKIISFMNLDSEDKEKILPFITWQPIEHFRLIEEPEHGDPV